MNSVNTTDIQNSNDTLFHQLMTCVQTRVGNSLHDFQMECCPDGLILRGFARRYYDKQLAQEVARQLFDLPIAANEIEVL